jgi:acyl-CoA dehydrogenase
MFGQIGQDQVCGDWSDLIQAGLAEFAFNVVFLGKSEAANLMRWKACEKIDAMQNAGAESNMAKYLAAKASWEAANVCLQTHGGFGFACEYDIERKFRETRLYQVAPISTNMIFSYVAEHILGLPRSF